MNGSSQPGARDAQIRGDFQTPPALAAALCRAVASRTAPASLLEPSCGRGSLIDAALAAFPKLEALRGVELHPEHLEAARRALPEDPRLDLRRGDIFALPQEAWLEGLPEPVLILANPPWITMSRRGKLAAGRGPARSRQQAGGLASLLGGSNFDVAEWLLRRLIDASRGRAVVLAVLCKLSVARRVLAALWAGEGPAPRRAELRRFCARRHFKAAVEACALILDLSGPPGPKRCAVYESLEAAQPGSCWEQIGADMAADAEAYRAWSHLQADEDRAAPWRSGVKHDCARVMELTALGGGRYRNGLGEEVELEPGPIYPLLKSSDLARGRAPRKVLLIPQRSLAEDPETSLSASAPRVLAYLCRHGAALDGRGSSIYRGRPRFAVFGLGPYSFAPWKVGISGFYRGLSFRLIGPREGRPVMLDDTGYFLPFDDEARAREAAAVLNAAAARAFYESRVFWDAKRPITLALLRRLDLEAAAKEAH